MINVLEDRSPSGAILLRPEAIEQNHKPMLRARGVLPI
jgi:hypothetical protein